MSNSCTDPNLIAERLKKSTVRRAGIVRKFGFVPKSVVTIGRGTFSKFVFHYGRDNGQNISASVRAEKKGGIYRHPRLAAFSLDRSTRETRKVDGTTKFSIMPPELVDFFVKFYAKPGDTYLDPFMGQGVQMQVARIRGLHYYGMDCCREFVSYIQQVRDKIDDGSTTVQATLGDSRFPTQIPDGIGDFGFTSPPYWDIEDYDDSPEQLGVGKSYEDFIAGMRDVARAWLPKFKSGAFFVVNVNDFRKNGKFYPYHADTTRLFAEAGWLPFDTWIILGVISGLSQVYAGERIAHHYAPKVHEYGLVFRAP